MKSNISAATKNFTRRHWLMSIFSGVFCISIDQILKFFAHTAPEYTYYFVPQLIGWEYFENPGIAFGIPIPQFIVIPLSIIIIIGGISFLNKEHKNVYNILGAILLIAGAVSNLIDRSIYGFTIDYIRIITSIFNLADLLIVVGGILLLKGNKKNNKEQRTI